MSAPEQVDLLIRGGRVIDPASEFDGVADVAISNGKIAEVGTDLDQLDATRTIDASGLLVVPGLIDIHAHTYTHMSHSIDPDLIGVQSGVTTVVDAGTAGPCTWAPFYHQVIRTAKTRTLAFLHIARNGQAFIPAIRIDDDIDLDATVQTAQAYPDAIVGIKLRAVGPAVTTMGARMVELTRQAARESGGMQMIHIGDPDAEADGPTLTEAVLTNLERGDILAHIYTHQPGSLLDGHGQAMPEVFEARDRGVVMESSPGGSNFSFEVAKRLMDQGLLPDVIGTDLTARGRGFLVHSLTEIMAKYIALGLSLHDVIRMTTSTSAKVLGLDDKIGRLAPGYEADVTLLRQEQGRWTFRDLPGETLEGDTALVPVLTVKAGEMIAPEWGPRPWGWLPESAPDAS
ncbi:MAG: amidohydrolase/deacetylase family metallohydrolase [Thermomicrobiales bacterium]